MIQRANQLGELVEYEVRGFKRQGDGSIDFKVWDTFKDNGHFRDILKEYMLQISFLVNGYKIDK